MDTVQETAGCPVTLEQSVFIVPQSVRVTEPFARTVTKPRIAGFKGLRPLNGFLISHQKLRQIESHRYPL
jgi:hypothetical protein